MDFSQSCLEAGFTAVATALGEEPFLLSEVVEEADFSGGLGEVEEDGAAALDELVGGVLSRCEG
jgi:hypothetical protein